MFTVRDEARGPRSFAVSEILPPKKRGPTEPTSLRLPKELLTELKEIAEESGYTRTEVITRFLWWAAETHKKQEGSRKK